MEKSFWFLLLIYSFFIGCADSAPERHINAMPKITLPAGNTVVNRNTLELKTSALPALKKDWRYVAWATSGKDFSALGELTQNGTLNASFTSSGKNPQIIVTEELKESFLPKKPSEFLILKGNVGEKLTYLPLNSAGMASSSAEIHMTADTITINLKAMPVLDGHFSYGVWFHSESESETGSTQKFFREDFPSFLSETEPHAGMDMGNDTEEIDPDMDHETEGTTTVMVDSAVDIHSEETTTEAHNETSGYQRLGLFKKTEPLILKIAPGTMEKIHSFIITVETANCDSAIKSSVEVLYGEITLPGQTAQAVSHSH